MNKLLLLILVSAPSLSGQVMDEKMYLHTPHFEITTPTVTYLYDRTGGGFSSIIDSDGLEWIGFKPGKGEVPGSAATDFRGLPNLVFRGEDNGSGHPGFENCVSVYIPPNQIQTETKSGHWEWVWTFTEKGALLEIIRTDTSRHYWFLYEGTPGGSFDPKNQYWGNDRDGLRIDTPPIGSDKTGKGTWKWAYFGHKHMNRCMYVVHLTPDEHTDNFSYMGSSSEGIESADGMVVFGLGRDGGTPLMSGLNRFFIGFYEFNGIETKLHKQLEKQISIIE